MSHLRRPRSTWEDSIKIQFIEEVIWLFVQRLILSSDAYTLCWNGCTPVFLSDFIFLKR